MTTAESLKTNYPSLYNKLSSDGAEFTDEQINDMSSRELFEAILHWEGIIGYTSFIVNTIASVLDVKAETFDDLEQDCI